jgi:membrane peptidoglycan carboxypeptidase
LAEAALLAGLPKAPSRFAPHRFPERAIHRRNEVLQQMAAQGLITQEQAANSIKSPLFQASLFQVSLAPQEFNSPAIDPLMAYGFWSTYARQFKGESSLGMRLSSVHLSMDAYLQEQLQQTLANLVTSMPPSEPSVPVPSAIWQGAGVILDGYSGDLLALQGSRSFTESPFNRAMYMKRAMGSLILPFIYAAALQAGYPWDAHMEDAFVHLRPEHAVGILESVGLDYTLDFLKTLGLRPSEDLDLVLGFQVMTPNELAKAFARLWFPESRRYLHPFAPYTLFQDLPLQPWGSVPHTHPLLHERTNFQVRYGLNTHVRQVYEPTSQVSGMSGQDIHKKNCWFVGTLDSHLLLLWTGTDHEQATLPNALCGRALAIAGLSLLGGARSPTEK